MKIYHFFVKGHFILLVILILTGGIIIATFLGDSEIVMALAITNLILLAILLGLRLFKSKPKSKRSALQNVQEQLMMQEKLASVGLLSAGIAHEIKNPLNFINNFSDMTIELIEELKDELEKPLASVNEEEKLAINSVIEGIVVNCKKINEHGKRAESIVKNMLIQARSAKVEKSEQDVNALLEEYLNLAYHGMRAQDTKLNAKMEKHLDKNIKPIIVDQQSIGRVFLNIINNALYAANEKAGTQNANFMPTIIITSEQTEENVIIKIKDNGNGIPENIRNKIFEPFFTTKPAGHGTGLGLPICYDIVVHDHGGKLEVNSKVGEFTEFIITLPKVKSK